MYNRVTTRKIPRTEGPTTPPRVAQTVDAVVAKWIPVTAALLACAVTPARAKLDVRAYDWQPAFTWVQPVVAAQVSTWHPAFTTEAASFRLHGRRLLDVRSYEWGVDEASWIAPALVSGPTVAQTWPAFQQSALSGRTAARRLLDVRSYDWGVDEASWIVPASGPTVAQTWPAFQQSALSGQTLASARLDVRRVEWTADEGSWISATQTQAPTVAQTAPAWTAQEENYRTPTKPALDLFRTASSPNLFGVPDDWITWVPVQDDGGRTRDRGRLDVRAYEWGQPAWITAAIPVPATTAQLWPAVLHGTGLNYRTPDRTKLDLRRFDWAPQPAWITANLPAPPPDATVAQQLPALLQALEPSYRTRDRAKLDVRSGQWAPASSWITQPVNSTVARWAPAFTGTPSYRTRARQPSPDVRRAPVYNLGWYVPTSTVSDGTFACSAFAGVAFVVDSSCTASPVSMLFRRTSFSIAGSRRPGRK